MITNKLLSERQNLFRNHGKLNASRLKLLALGAVMSSSLADRDPRDRCSAPRAWFSGLLIHTKMVLVFPTTINPVDAGSIMQNRLGKHLADRSQQFAGLRPGEAAGSR